VVTPFDARFLDRVEGKAEEDDAADIRESFLRGGQGRHSATHRLTPGKKRKTVRESGGGGYRRPHGLQENGLKVGASATLLRVRELVPERGDTPSGQATCQNFHKNMPHPRAGPVPQYQQAIGLGRAREHGRDDARTLRRLETVLDQLDALPSRFDASLG
jgi:hypothetical protein